MLDCLNVLIGDVSQVGSFWTEFPDHSNSVFNGPLILGGIRPGEVHVSIQFSCQRLMVCKGLVFVDSHRFDERLGDAGQVLFNGQLGTVCIAPGNLFEPGEQRSPVDDDHQGGFVSLAYHQVNF